MPRTRLTPLLALVLALTGLGIVTAPSASAAPPANDALSAAVTLAPGVTQSLNNSEATLEAGESTSPCATLKNTLWFTYTPTANHQIQLLTGPSGHDTVMALYSGPASGATTAGLAQVSCNDDGGASGTSKITTSLTAGTTYYVQVGSYAGTGPVSTPGPVEVTLSILPPANDLLADATAIAPLQPGGTAPVVDTTDATLETGEAARTQAGCTTIQNTVWYRYTPTQTGAITVKASGSSNKDTVLRVWSGPSSSPAIAGLVAVGCNDDVNGAADRSSSYTWTPTTGTTYYVQVGTFGTSGPAGPGPIAVAMTDANPPANDLVGQAQVLPSGSTTISGTVLTDTTNATATAGEATDLVGSPTVWYAWTAPYTGTAIFRTQPNGGPNVDTFLYAFAGTTYTAAAAIAHADDNAGAGDRYSTIAFPVVAGSLYRVLAGTYPNNFAAGATGPFKLSWSYQAPGNDDLTDAATVTGGTGSVAGDNRFATSEAGDPSIASGLAGGYSVWYSWTAPTSGGESFETSVQPNGDTVLDIYTEGAGGGLTLVTEGDDIDVNGGNYASHADFATTAGTTYLVRVDGYAVTTSGPFTLSWSPYPVASTTTTISASVAGTTVTLDATVSAAAAPMPTGTLTYTDGASVVGVAGVLDGVVDTTVTTLEPGSHTITGTFVSASFKQAGSTDTEGVQVDVATTTGISVAGTDPSPTLSATVVPSDGTIAPIGSVSFYDGGVLLGSAPAVGGVADLTLSDAAPGNHLYSAAFTGDVGSGFLDSSSAEQQVALSVTTTTSLTASATGQSVTLGVDVDPTEGTSTPPGTVELFDGTTSLGSFALVSGHLGRTLTGVAPGTHAYRAVYTPETASYGASTSATKNVAVATPVVASKTSIKAPSSAKVGSRPSITITVKRGSAAAAGKVTIRLDGKTLKTVTLKGGKVTFKLPALKKAGKAKVKVSYLGNPTTKPSTKTVTITVKK